MARSTRWTALALALGTTLGPGCHVRSYLDPAGPRYAGAAERSAEDPEPEVRIVTFNVEFARHVDRAIVALRERETLRDVDVLLMQEMNEPGIVSVAEALDFHYVYYPATQRGSGGFGNAVLSRWPIVEDHKIILPHPSPANGERRIAVAATIAAPFGRMVAVSVHSETPWMPLRGRLDQLGTILADVEERYDPVRTPVVIGGDMNTPEGPGIERIRDLFRGHAFRHATADVGPTADYYFGFVVLDYVFTRGLTVVDAGSERTDASDHMPLYVVSEPVQHGL